MIKNIFFILTTFIVFISCVDTIEIKLPEDSPEIKVIEGYVERSASYIFYATVSQSTQVDGYIVDKRIDADLHLIYNGNKILEIENGKKLQIPVGEFHHIYGGNPLSSTFKLQVETTDGNVYESEDQEILSVPKPTKLHTELIGKETINSAGNIINDEYLELFVTSPVVNTENQRVSLRWDITGLYTFVEAYCDPLIPPKTCFIPDSFPIFKTNIIHENAVSGDTLKSFPINFSKTDYKFSSGYYYSVVQKSLTSKAAVFWEQVKQSNPAEQTIFSTTPGSIISNIKNVNQPEEKVLGFFYASEVDTIRLGVRPPDAGSPLERCLIESTYFACCTCPILKNSSLNRPDYWIF